MSSTFSITDKEIQSAASLEEIRNAYNERRAAIHQGPRSWNGAAWSDGDTAVAAGTNIQKKEFFTEIQNWIETYCERFMDPTVDSYDGEDTIATMQYQAISAGQGSWEYFCKNIAGFGLASGAAYGWRRSTEIGEFTTRGQVQAGDYIRWTDETEGYFDLWQDIRDCLSKLKITPLPGTETYGTYPTVAEGESVKSYSEEGTLAACMDSYEEVAWGLDDEPYLKHTNNYYYGNTIEGMSCKVDFYVPPSIYSLAQTVEIYLVAESQNYEWDAAGSGLTQDKWSLIDTPTPAATGMQTTGRLLTTDPYDCYDNYGGTAHGSTNFFGWKADLSGGPLAGIIIWDFSHSD